MRKQSTVPADQWRRGTEASARIGRWLKDWEDRAKTLRAGGEPPERPPRRRRPPADR